MVVSHSGRIRMINFTSSTCVTVQSLQGFLLFVKDLRPYSNTGFPSGVAALSRHLYSVDTFGSQNHEVEHRKSNPNKKRNDQKNRWGGVIIDDQSKNLCMQSSLWSGSAHTLDNSHFPTQVINVKRGGIEFMETFLRYNHKTHLIEAYLSEEVILIIRGCTSANREKMFRIHSLTRQVILQCNVVIIRIIPSIIWHVCVSKHYSGSTH